MSGSHPLAMPVFPPVSVEAPRQTGPFSDAEFAAAMARLGPFEAAPHIAVGVSGGGDSLALILLADRWVRGRGGRATGLVVDHGLRVESASEAATVEGWLAARGIACHVLRWHGPKPRSAIQAKAREARHGLLAAWCRDAGVLHLLLGHHLHDQRETAMLRQERKSGPDGLAAMSAISGLADLRILRPLLHATPEALKATLRAAGQNWIEDPSNLNPAFARTRLRSGPEERGSEGEPDLRQRGIDRRAAEASVAELLGRSVAVYPEGWASLEVTAWHAARRDIVRRALARVTLTIGGGAYAPRGERLDRLLQALLAGELAGGRTLGGCRFAPRQGQILVVREAAAAVERREITGPGPFAWDDRFSVNPGAVPPNSGLVVARLGADGWREVAEAAPALRHVAIPSAVRPTLPALFDLEGVLAVPHLTYRRPGADPDSLKRVSVTFCPRHALAGPGFVVN